MLYIDSDHNEDQHFELDGADGKQFDLAYLSIGSRDRVRERNAVALCLCSARKIRKH